MDYHMSEAESGKIINYFGREFYEKLLSYLEIYSDKWELTTLQLVNYFSMNCIFLCHSKRYGDAVMKISGNSNQDFLNEYNVLREYGGNKLCKLLAGDIEKKVMLLERIMPGTRLQSEPVLENRLAVFSAVYNRMHIQPENAALYKKYGVKVGDFAEYIGTRSDCKELYSYALRAKDIYASIASVYRKEMLLHADLNCTNILLGSDGRYIAIDPQGLLGDPVFDTPRYILSEYYDSMDISLDERFEKINRIIAYFESSLGIPGEILKQCFYVEIVTFESWAASVGDYDINNVIFADRLMGNRQA